MVKKKITHWNEQCSDVKLPMNFFELYSNVKIPINVFELYSDVKIPMNF